MAVIAHVVLRGVTREQYDAVREAAGWLERAPAGGLSHATWWEGDDCHNLDGWESEQAFHAFSEQRLGPAVAQVGVAVEPEVTFHEAHEVFTPARGAVTATPAAASVTDNVATLRSGYEAFARGDVPAVLALFDPDIVWSTPETVQFGGAYRGPAGVGEFFSKLPENYQELNVEPRTFVDGGDTVVAIGAHRGRSRSGEPFRVEFVHTWTFKDGKATSFTEQFDTVKMNAALGPAAVIPPARTERTATASR
jgi:ketosteroid isomerase-like protein